MDHRSLFRAAAGMFATAASGVPPKGVLDASAGLDVGTPVSALNVPTSQGEIPAFWDKGGAIRKTLWVKRERQDRSRHAVPPPHIAAMRSWSGTFKDMQAEKERAEVQRLIDLLEDEVTAVKLLRRLGVEV